MAFPSHLDVLGEQVFPSWEDSGTVTNLGPFGSPCRGLESEERAVEGWGWGTCVGKSMKSELEGGKWEAKGASNNPCGLKCLLSVPGLTNKLGWHVLKTPLWAAQWSTSDCWRCNGKYPVILMVEVVKSCPWNLEPWPHHLWCWVTAYCWPWNEMCSETSPSVSAGLVLEVISRKLSLSHSVITGGRRVPGKSSHSFLCLAPCGLIRQLLGLTFPD